VVAPDVKGAGRFERCQVRPELVVHGCTGRHRGMRTAYGTERTLSETTPIAPVASNVSYRPQWICANSDPVALNAIGGTTHGPIVESLLGPTRPATVWWANRLISNEGVVGV